MAGRNARTERLALAGCVLAGAMLRLAYAALPRPIRWDEASHLNVARNLARGLGFSESPGLPEVHLPPLLPFLSAGLLRLGLTPEWATAAVHIITGALLCLPIYGLARAIYGQRTAMLAALLMAVTPALAVWPFFWSTMTEAPFLLTTFSGIWAARRALDSSRPAFYAATGISFGLAYLTRPEGLTTFAVVGLYMLGWHVLRTSPPCPPLPRGEGGVGAPPPSQGGGWGVGARLALAVAACLIVMAPYVIYLHGATGRWILSGKVGLIMDIAPAYWDNDQAAHDRAVSRLDSTGQEIMWASPERFNRTLSDYVLADPARFIFGVRHNLQETWRALFHNDLFATPIIILAALGLFARPWRRRRWWDEGLLWAALLPLTSFWLFFVVDRFLVSVLPVGLIWAAAGLDQMARWAAASAKELRPALSRGGQRLAATAPVILLLAFSLALGLGRYADVLLYAKWDHALAGRWLATVTPSAVVIMSRHSEIGLYADRPLISSPNASLAQMLAYGRARNASYLVIDSAEITAIRPQLAALGDPAQAPPELEYLRTFTSEGRATLVYRLRD